MGTSSRRAAALAAVFGLLATLALAGIALGVETTLSAELAGGTDGDEDGTGSATIVIDPDAGTACWELSAESIEPVIQSHIHVGAEGVSGDVVVPLDVEGFEGASEGCAEDQDTAALQAIVDDPAGYYVNLHTADFEAGAIRGQLAASSAPPDTALGTSRDGGVATTFGVLLLIAAAGLGARTVRTALARD